jgi:hypothetical protein
LSFRDNASDPLSPRTRGMAHRHPSSMILVPRTVSRVS